MVCKEESLIRVINHNVEAHRLPEELVFVGRPSTLGNPFVLQHERHRSTVIAKYEGWLRYQMKANPKRRDEVNRIASLVASGQPVALACFCAPKRCHADIIKQFVLEIIEERKNEVATATQ